MNRAINFTLEYWTDDGWYVGRLSEIPGVFSQGETLEELQENIREAYQLISAYEGEYDTREISHNKTYGDRGCGVKRGNLIRELEKAGCYLKRHGKKHDIYSTPK
jgi:predicted RNase H-like HicB family nuclease